MSNLCYNHLHVIGQPERVEEFRLLNSQYIPRTPPNRENEAWRNPADYPDLYPSHDLVGPRKHPDLSFSSLLPIQSLEARGGIDVWGVKWDLAASCTAITPVDRSPATLAYGETFVRSLSLSFDTASRGPHKWLDAIGERFPELTISLSSVEQDDDVFAAQVVSGGNREEIVVSGRHRDAPARAARRTARVAMPQKRKMTRLQIAIAEDDTSSTQRYLKDVDPDGLVGGMWPPIFYAAKAGAVDVFAMLLLTRPDDVNYATASGIQVSDILLDIYPHQPKPMVEARFQMAQALTEHAPDIWRCPLASGVMPAELAARLAITPVLDSLVAAAALHVVGTMGGWAAQLAADATHPRFDVDLARLGVRYTPTFIENTARVAAENDDVALLQKAVQASPRFSNETDAMLRGDIATRNGEKVSQDFAAAYRALLARRAMVSAMECNTSRSAANVRSPL
jgi:hypothetical protein